MYGSLQDIAALAKPDALFEPAAAPEREREINSWRQAVRRVKSSR
jgi:glycerol kinase